MWKRAQFLVLGFGFLAVAGCQTEGCPPGVTDSIFCRASFDGSLDGCVDGASCNPPDDLCAVGIMRCASSGPRCEVTGRLSEGDVCGGGLFTCAADGTCSVCADGAVCNTGNPCATGRTDCASGSGVCVSDTPTDGAPCGTGGVCGGDVCSECIPGSVCNTGNPCTTGRSRCPDPTTTVCEPDADLPRGTTCGDGLACGGTGSCDVCADGTLCNTGNPCTSGRTDCGSGSPVCVPDDDIAPGTGCGSGGVCSGAGECSECIAGTICNTGNPCTSGTLACPMDNPVCMATTDVPSGVRCGVGRACDGSGSCSTCVPGDPCVTAACQVGTIDCGSGSPVCAATGPAPAGAECRPRVDACDVPETCDGSGGACPPDGFAVAGTACIGRGTCDGAGVCVPFCTDGMPCSTGRACELGTTDCSSGSPVCVAVGPMATGIVCRASTGECDAEEICDGVAVTCPADAPEPAGRTCTGGVCDGAGACVSCSPGAPCATGIACEAGTLDCTGGTPLCVAAGPATLGTVCRAIAGPCDLDELCDGVSTACPADAFDSTTVCRTGVDACDSDETCDGSGTACPPDVPAVPGTVCPAGVCDGAGTCAPCTDGTPCSTGRDCERGQIDCSSGAPVCTSVGLEPGGTSCRVPVGPCDAEETCTGSSPDCPADGVQSSGTTCRPVAGGCDVAETCDGASTLCPADAVQLSGTGCRASAGACDMPESCDGISNACPADDVTPAGTVCRPAAALCDRPETCTGSSGICPADTMLAVGTVCRMAVDICDVNETCDGVTPPCPADAYAALGTICPVGVCDGSGTCSMCGGICPMRPNATTTCSGSCGYVCLSGFADCNGTASDGCEISTDMDTSHCGACGNVCPSRVNASRTCVVGGCGYSCSAGFADCNGLAPDGCEINIDVDITHCGMCSNACPSRANATTTCASGACGFSCMGGFGDCNGSAADGCETDLNLNINNCGACANSCPSRANSSRTCAGGTCGFTCTAPFGDCNGSAADGCEIDTDSTVAHCGFCGNACPSRPNSSSSCAGGSCGFSCDPGYADCNGVAADGCEIQLASDITHCGTCGNTCPLRPNASPTCAAGACGYSCNVGFTDCNGLAADGCEVQLATDTGNCGSCGNMCPSRANSTTNCTGGSCGFTCTAPFGDCNGVAADGCETNTDTAVDDCSACGVSCPARANASRTCVTGTCGFMCNGGFADCNGSSADGCESELAIDPLNCGGCGNICAMRPNSVPTCAGSSCGFACLSGWADCNGVAADGCEVQLAIDTSNCGTCGNVCAMRPNASTTCASGSCGYTCNPSFGDCNGVAADGCEVSLTADISNCGSCGNVCPNRPNSSRFCSSSACGFSCDPGFGDCNANPVDGCEVNLRTSVSNCGSCGNVCMLPNAVEGCTVGVCTVAACDPSYYDVDAVAANGCECQDEGFSSSCGAAEAVGSIAIGGSATRAGKTVPNGGSDWFQVSFPPTSGTYGGGTPTIDFSVNDGGIFRFEIVGSCGGGSLACGMGGMATNITSWSMVDDQSDLAMGFTSRLTTWPSTIYVRVYRNMSGLSCANYVIRFRRP